MAERRCRICNGFLCRYNAEPICWVHQPDPPVEPAVLTEVAPGEWKWILTADCRELVAA